MEFPELQGLASGKVTFPTTNLIAGNLAFLPVVLLNNIHSIHWKEIQISWCSFGEGNVQDVPHFWHISYARKSRNFLYIF